MVRRVDRRAQTEIDDRLLEPQVEVVLGRVADRDLLGLALLIEEQDRPLEISGEAVRPVDRGERAGECLPDLTLGAVDQGARDPGLLVGGERPLDGLGHGQGLRRRRQERRSGRPARGRGRERGRVRPPVPPRGGSSDDLRLRLNKPDPGFVPLGRARELHSLADSRESSCRGSSRGSCLTRQEPHPAAARLDAGRRSFGGPRHPHGGSPVQSPPISCWTIRRSDSRSVRAQLPRQILVHRVPQPRRGAAPGAPRLGQAQHVRPPVAGVRIADGHPVPFHDVERRDERGGVHVGVEGERLLAEGPWK